jgi:hypothetical protein
MAHDRHTPLDQKSNGLRHAPPAFELNRPATGLLEHARRRGERLLLRCFITAERQIDHDQRLL